MKRFLGWLALAGVVIGLDQWSKLAVLARFAEYESLKVTEYFNLVLVYNPGSAFGLLADQSGWQRWLFFTLAILICSYLLRLTWQHRNEIIQPAAFALIIGGAIANNLIDRPLYGAVVDFLDFHYLGHHYPAFNLADSAIFLGVCLIAGLSIQAQLREWRLKKNQTENSSK